jgi:hypothetical protein
MEFSRSAIKCRFQTADPLCGMRLRVRNYRAKDQKQARAVRISTGRGNYEQQEYRSRGAYLQYRQ